MKTTTTNTTSTTTVNAATSPEAMLMDDELTFWRMAISPDSLFELMDLQSDREHARRLRGEDEYSGKTRYLSIDEALNQALKVARKTARSDLKAARGEWAVSKLQQQARNKATA